MWGHGRALEEISLAVDPGCHAVMLDQAVWHRSARLPVPANITLLPLPPPPSPELNPVENVRQFVRDNWLSNRVFASYDGIVGDCRDAWNKLVEEPWRIMFPRPAPVASKVSINAGWYSPVVQTISMSESTATEARTFEFCTRL